MLCGYGAYGLCLNEADNAMVLISFSPIDLLVVSSCPALPARNLDSTWKQDRMSTRTSGTLPHHTHTIFGYWLTQIKRHLVMLYLSADGHFGLQRKSKVDDPDDISLLEGTAFFPKTHHTRNTLMLLVHLLKYVLSKFSYDMMWNILQRNQRVLVSTQSICKINSSSPDVWFLVSLLLVVLVKACFAMEEWLICSGEKSMFASPKYFVLDW